MPVLLWQLLSIIIAYIVELWEIIGVAVLIAPSVCVTPKVHLVYNNVLFCYGSCSTSQDTSHRVCTELFEMASIIIHQELCIILYIVICIIALCWLTFVLE